MTSISNTETLNKYKSHTHREHIYKIPDTYIGSIESSTNSSWRVSDDETHMINAELTSIPGLYKIFDEVVVNAWDQFIRMKNDKRSKNRVTYINIDVDKETGRLCVENDGKGIDILMHPEHNIYTVEMIFGKLLTSTNYTENEERLVGGKNGYGSKLTNIFSTVFEVETIDTINKKKYYQKFENNMTKIHKPKISTIASTEKEYTKITFQPDFARFGIDGWSDDMIHVLKRRAYEISACCGDILNVKFNGIEVPIRSFKDFSKMYFENDVEIVYEKNDRWEVAFGVCDDFKHVSFVNGIYTSKGGKHVDYIVNSICKKIVEVIKKKEKITVKSSYIRDNLFVCVNALIVNPSFDSQTKDYLTTTVSKFGSTMLISDKLVDTIMFKMNLFNKIMDTYQFKESKNLKKTDGKKKNRLYGIPKLDDANDAGGKKSSDCTLILTEGDSAKAMAIAGISVVGRDSYGVFPLRGKVINAREKITTKIGQAQVANNQELINMKKILGLEQGEKYTNTSKLRYGHILIMTDQDLDGSHIKGLIINWLAIFWPELAKIPGFISCMNTPIVKMLNKKKEIMFYSLQKYEEWKKNNTKYNKLGWKSKYYKGLGTSTTSEAKEYFRNMKCTNYLWDEKSNNAIDLAFNKNRSDDRKKWLGGIDVENILDADRKTCGYDEFINHELIHFSNYDLKRSIPHMMDGLKPSQRKILFSCFKRKLKNEIRVAQLAGYVSEKSGYHHGEASLNGAIIAMAQNFIGSNNIHLLEPNGQFGTRILGGKDAGSPRYLHTCLSEIAYTLFIEDDSNVLEFQDDDGMIVEPKYYAPVIPFVLCNGTHGIGTGYSTSIPSYNPVEICEYVKNKINDKPNTKNLLPYFHNFEGVVKDIDGQIYTKGTYKILNYKTILISELPIGTWIDTYKAFIDDIVTGLSDKTKKTTKSLIMFEGIKNYKSQSTESKVHFEIEVDPVKLSEWLKSCNSQKRKGDFVDDIEKKFKLVSKISTSNMHLYDKNNKIKKYSHINDIIDDFVEVREETYVKRKEFLVNKLKIVMNTLANRVRFIKCVLGDEIVIKKHTKLGLEELLAHMKFDLYDDESYNYLINTPVYQFTSDNVDKLNNDFKSKEIELKTLIGTSVKKMWNFDIDEFNKTLVKHLKKF